jgi:F420-dependent oxidoreductase-like protein
VQFGLQINPYLSGATGNSWDAVAAVARVAEDGGFDSLWLYDHFLWDDPVTPDGPYRDSSPSPVIECFVGLAALAAITSRIRLGQLVLGVPYRNPALVAKMATSLDLISHGRSILGLGAAWHAREFAAYGWDFEELGTRMGRLEEAIQVVLAMWREPSPSFNGQYYRLDNALNDPAPIQRPHPPILVGGNGEKVTLRLVAQYGQWCNVFGEPEVVRHRFGVLREHCDRLHRPYDEITKSNHQWVLIGRDETEVKAKLQRWRDAIPSFAGFAGTPPQLIERFREYEAAGSQYCTFQMPDGCEVEPVRLFAQTVIPSLSR